MDGDRPLEKVLVRAMSDLQYTAEFSTDLNHGSSHKTVTYVYRAEDYELYILLYDCLKAILY